MSMICVPPDDVRAAVPMSEAIDALRVAFTAFARSEFEMPAREVLGDGKFLVMRVHHAMTSSLMVKTLSINFDRQPSITGTVVWSELDRPETLVADAETVTAIRTGAIVGLATDLLAPAHAARLTLIGAGAQAADQVRAVHAVRPLKSLTIVDRRQESAQRLASALAEELPGTVCEVSSDCSSAVRDADVVCCATTSTTPLFTLADLSAQVHVNAIGSFRPTMRELPVELLADATIVVDDRRAAIAEAGEIVDALAAGVIDEDQLIPLGDALINPLTASKTRTVFKTVGVAVQDWAIAQVLAGKLLG